MKLYFWLTLVQHWSVHPRFGSEFVTWLDEFVKHYQVESAPQGGSPAKAKRKEAPGGIPIGKKTKTAAIIVESSPIEHGLIAEAKLPNSSAWTQCRVGHNIYLTSKGATELTIAEFS